jgi:hypothetical protein
MGMNRVSLASASLKRLQVASSLAVSVIAIVVLWIHYHEIKRSYFDDTFIYLHVAQNAVELGTWQYFPIVDRPALVASSPLKAIVLTAATFIAWPLTGGERSLAAAATILPITAFITPLFFLPFWWRDGTRFALLLVPYALLAVSLDAVVEFEAGLIYWWIATVIRDFVERRSGPSSALAVAMGPFVRPDVALVGLLALVLAHQSRGDKLRLVFRSWVFAGLLLAFVWALICFALGVWPIPTTYWTKAALPKLYDTSFMVTFFVERMGDVALGVAPWRSRSLATALGLAWCLLIVVIAARSAALAQWRVVAVMFFVVLLMSRTPANFWWYYQNALVAFVAIAIVLLATRNAYNAKTACIALAISALAVVIPSRTLREPDIMWHFDKPSRVQGYLAMARTFAPDGTIELPELGRGYLHNPEIGITSYFGGRNAWIWDSSGLAQAQPDAMKSRLRSFYPKRLKELPQADASRLAGTRSDLPLFVAWATESRDSAYNVDGKCKHLLHERAICVSDVRALR